MSIFHHFKCKYFKCITGHFNATSLKMLYIEFNYETPLCENNRKMFDP